MNPAEKGQVLTRMARAAIARELGQEVPDAERPGWASEPAATFVTLTQNGQLRGCMGSLEARQALGDDVASNARAAAFRDPRFPPLDPAELAHTRIEVSLLSPAERLHFKDEADALAQLRPGVDGVILEAGWHRATFLPQVWEQLPTPAIFIAHLKRKAGLSPDYWSDDVRLARYTVEKYKESAS